MAHTAEGGQEESDIWRPWDRGIEVSGEVSVIDMESLRQSQEQPLLIGSVSAFHTDPSSPNPPSASVKNTISFALRTVTMLLCKPPFPLPTLATVAMECVRLFRICCVGSYRMCLCLARDEDFEIHLYCYCH